MDLISGLKSEVIRPVITLLTPGGVALSPYIIIIGHYIPRVASFWDDHPNAFVAIIVMCVIAVGLILEDVGASIEKYAWDKKLEQKNSLHISTWDDYLKLETNDEIVGQRYLRTVLIRMKFELSMAPAIISLTAGIIWIDQLYNVWSKLGVCLVTAFLLGLAVYLLWESYKSASILARARRLVVESKNRV